MKNFKDFGIKPLSQGLIGDKIKIDRIINRQITVEDYRLVPSKYVDKGNGYCLYLQIGIGETKHVIFTGSSVLMDAIKQVPKSDFPFITTIIRESERFEFT